MSDAIGRNAPVNDRVEEDGWPDPAGPGTRVVTRLNTGAKLSVVIALLFVILGVLLMLSPITRDLSQGVADCGSVVDRPTDDFTRGLCGSAPDIRQYQMFAAFAAALVVGIGGVMTFGATRQEAPAMTRRRDLDADDEL